jgi:hypothetical protein
MALRSLDGRRDTGVIDLGGELAVLLIGHPEVRIGGRLVSLPTRKTLLLLALLVVDGQQTRERLTALLWGEADEELGRTNLRHTLACRSQRDHRVGTPSRT